MLVQALRRGGIDAPFPIQSAVIPDIMAGRDVLGRAATGSGKTLAFGLPMLARLFGAPSAPRRPRGLILAPTRELAIQIESALDEPALSLGLRLATAVGGLPIKKQQERIARGVDVLIATPGRLTDLLGRKAVELSAIRVVTVDEADHMAELGFFPQLTALLNKVPDDAQQLLFSATLDETIDGLVQRYLTDPVRHEVGAAPSTNAPDSAETDTTTDEVDAKTAEPDANSEAVEQTGALSTPDITHYALHIRRTDKRLVVTEIAAREGRTLLFVRTQHGADKLARKLRESGIGAVALHGGKAQNLRSRTLAAFSDGTAPVLVATDIAARGLHIDDVSLVVHVDPPRIPRTTCIAPAAPRVRARPASWSPWSPPTTATRPPSWPAGPRSPSPMSTSVPAIPASPRSPARAVPPVARWPTPRHRSPRNPSHRGKRPASGPGRRARAARTTRSASRARPGNRPADPTRL